MVEVGKRAGRRGREGGWRRVARVEGYGAAVGRSERAGSSGSMSRRRRGEPLAAAQDPAASESATRHGRCGSGCTRCRNLLFCAKCCLLDRHDGRAVGWVRRSEGKKGEAIEMRRSRLQGSWRCWLAWRSRLPGSAGHCWAGRCQWDVAHQKLVGVKAGLSAASIPPSNLPNDELLNFRGSAFPAELLLFQSP